MGESGVYAIKHITTGKLYVGSTVNLKARKKQHFSDLRCGRHPNSYLQRAFNKHGESAFGWLVLEVASDDLLVKEAIWIKEFDTTNRRKGYNIALDTRAPMLGRKASAATKEKLSKQRQGSKHANAKIDENVVRSVFADHSTGMTMRELAGKYGIDYSNVSLILAGKAWKHLGLSHGKVRLDNTSGCVGVYYAKNCGKWIAEIKANKQYHRLGAFNTRDEAIAARKKGEEVYHGV